MYLLQAIYETIDTGNNAVRIFLADFSKGFDIIYHKVLLEELDSLNVDQTLVFWIKSFLTNRTQAVRVANTMSNWRRCNGSMPQGTKLGVTLS